MYETPAASGATQVLEQPIVRAFAGFSLMLVTERAIEGILVGLIRWFDVGSSLLFDVLWNLEYVRWLAILLTIVGWLVVAAKLEPFTIWLAAASYLFIAVLIENVVFDLPDSLIDVYFVLAPALLLPAVLYAVVALRAQRHDRGPATVGTTAAPPAMSFASPPPGTLDPSARVESVPAASADTSSDPSWLPDPRGEARLRWWDGTAWTDHTHDG